MDGQRLRAGEGALTYGRVLHAAVTMFKRHYVRVAGVAMILFVPPPLIVAALEGLRGSLETDPGLARGVGFFLGLLAVTAIRLLGPVVYAGYLEAAVGHEYYVGGRTRFRDVLSSLPWMRLIIADLVLLVGTVVGFTLFVVPGLIFLTLFSLVGPVIVLEHHAVLPGFRRTYQLSRTAWPMIAVLVVAFLIAEHTIAELIHITVHDTSLTVQVAAEWAVAVVIGGSVGLVEVALATELVARDTQIRSR